MPYQENSQVEIPVEELDRELVSRGAQIPPRKLFKFSDQEGTPQREAIMAKVKEFYDTGACPFPNKGLIHLSTPELINRINSFKVKVQQINKSIGISWYTKGIWFSDDRLDVYEIRDEKVKNNVNCVAAIFTKDYLIDEQDGLRTLKVKDYGKTFNLCHHEPFRHQPIAAGRVSTGFLVKDDVIATAGHCADDKNVTGLRFVFGFKMEDASTPVTRVANENIYNGVEIIRGVFDRKVSGMDWALVKLDRGVEGQTPAALSQKDICPGQPVYVIGHPVGLPLKYAPGGCVFDIHETYFSAGLDVYCGSSGSPVFDSDTHEVIGIVVRGDDINFRWTGKGWASVIYRKPEKSSPIPQCTRVSQFIKYCK